MRDSKRIKRILKKVEKIWSKNPDWRLTQLIMNALSLSRDPYHIEDEELEKALDNLKGEYRMNQIKKIYYAHPLSIYDSPQEERDLAFLKLLWPDAEIYNPNSKLDSENYKDSGMHWFFKIISGCDLVVFRSFPDGKIGAGVWEEIMFAEINCSIPTLEIPILLESRRLTVDDTREYLKHAGKR